MAASVERRETFPRLGPRMDLSWAVAELANAIDRGDLERVRLLLKVGADCGLDLANESGVHGRLPLFCATACSVRRVSYPIALALLEEGADVNVGLRDRSVTCYLTPAYLAAKIGAEHLLRLYCERGARIEIKPTRVEHPMCILCEWLAWDPDELQAHRVSYAEAVAKEWTWSPQMLNILEKASSRVRSLEFVVARFIHLEIIAGRELPAFSSAMRE